jgi:PAS domain S-box-containing protein
MPLRVILVLIGTSVLGLLTLVAVQVATILRPAADDLRGQASDLLADHQAIVAHLDRLTVARRRVARLQSPTLPATDRPPDPQTLRREVRDLLDRSIGLRNSAERADVPLAIRVLMAEAAEQETQIGVRLNEALRHLELRVPSDAAEDLRAAGVHSDSATRLLSEAQRVALVDVVEGEERLLERLELLERWVTAWTLVGFLGLVAAGLIVRSRFYRPVLAMERTVRQVSAGDLDAEVHVAHADELGRLGLHLNAMTHVLRDRALEESRKRENLTERFGRILDESSNQICVFDATTLQLVQANRGARVSLDYSREEIAGLRLPDLFGETTRRTVVAQLESLRTGASPGLRVAASLRRKDGSLLASELTIQHSVEGENSVFITVAEDAGIRQRVRELDERLRTFTLTEQHALSSGDLDASLRPLTAMAADALRASRCGVWREVAGETFPVVAFDVASGEHLTGLPLPQSGPTPQTSPLEIPVRSGGRVVARVVFEHAGEQREWSAEETTFARAVADIVLRVIDASERRALEQALEKAQRMDSIGQLAGGVAHDFNNILTAILGNLEACRADLDPGTPMDEALAEAEQAALRAAELTRQLLTFARHQVVDTRVVDVNARLREAEPMLRRLLGFAVHLTIDLEPELAPVRLGIGQIEQLIVNLAVNARDAMPSGGSISITTRHLMLDAAEVLEHPGIVPGAYVELAVADTGIGMDARTVERVFEPFYTTKRLGEGTGLGLAVCYGVVRNAGGTIAVTSVPGRGSTFRIRLPIASEPPSAPSPPPLEPGARGSEVILLAEDEPPIRALLHRALEARGYRVLIATDGQQAVELGENYSGEISLLISDVVMPRLGGPDAARRMRETRPGLPVLFISGFTASADIRSGDLADTAFVAKPFTPDELAQKVRELLDTAAASSGGASPR